ncbi:MAG: hypothetical protein ACFUZC_01625 [Chthoniobacteraceae bacterium]
MKSKLWFIMALILSFMSACTNNASRHQSAHKQGQQALNGEDLRGYIILLYGALWSRESFSFPASLDDHSVDEAMRLNIHFGSPLEIVAIRGKDYYTVCANTADALKEWKRQKGVQEERELIRYLTEQVGVTAFLVGYCHSMGGESFSDIEAQVSRKNVQISTYYKLVRLKEERVRVGTWNP